jgi:ABC-type Co2+ transport system permease subunit
MDEAKRIKFFANYHESLNDNLNHISDDLLRAKWFFLATIAALGTAYIKIYDSQSLHNKWSFWLICLVGNIIFWLLSEYTLSHAFLFRFIQARLAKIEKMFKDSTGDRNSIKVAIKIKDPTDDETFIKNNRLFNDYFIPDQFLPIYWASTWLIIINSIICFLLCSISANSKLTGNVFVAKGFLFYSIFSNSKSIIFDHPLFYTLISVPFIWKLWTYYVYKLDKFIKENCTFKIIFNIQDPYFKFPFLQSIIPCCSAFIIYLGIIWLTTITFDFKDISLLLIIAYFWPVLAGLVIHFLRTILRVNLTWKIFGKLFTPAVSKNEYTGDYKVLLSPWLRLFSVLYTIT